MKAPKDSIVDFEYLLGKSVIVRISGDVELHATLKGYDVIGNLVLDETEEYEFINDKKKFRRVLGNVFVRGPHVQSILPKGTLHEIENPF